MEKFIIEKDIETVFLMAPQFPMDVPATYEKLYALLPDKPERRFFGISHPDKTGVIQYKAAAEILPGDENFSPELKRFTILKGLFAAKYIVNHFADANSIGNTFQELLRHPQLDPQGYCLELYKNYTDVDVHCMVRILS